MCNNCNCDNYDQCSIVGYMPNGFCCTKCYLYDEMHTCLKMKSRPLEKEGAFKPISTKIEGGVLKVVIGQKGKKIPIIIDFQKQLGSK